MLKKTLISLIAVAAVFSIFSLFGQSKEGFRSVGTDEFERAVRDSSYIVLDVRTAAEYAEGHIPGTDHNIDVLDDSFTAKAVALLPEGSSVALYCRSGNRSKSAAKILAERGYNVVELASGFRGWASSGREVAR